MMEALGDPVKMAAWKDQAHSTVGTGKEIADTFTGAIDAAGAWLPIIIDSVFGGLGVIMAPGGLFGKIIGMF